jgi:hypothetical protein
MRRLFIVGLATAGLWAGVPATASAQEAQVLNYGGCLHNFAIPGSGGESVQAFQTVAGPLTGVNNNPPDELLILPPGQLEQLDPSGFLCGATLPGGQR